MATFFQGLYNASTSMYSFTHALNLGRKQSWIGDPKSNDMCAVCFAHGGRMWAKQGDPNMVLQAREKYMSSNEDETKAHSA